MHVIVHSVCVMWYVLRRWPAILAGRPPSRCRWMASASGHAIMCVHFRAKKKFLPLEQQQYQSFPGESSCHGLGIGNKIMFREKIP